MNTVTSLDVARRAGVSQPTVSRALRDQRGTSEATRKLVRDVARELGYVPLQSGRSLATRRSRRIGIVVGELANPFYPALVDPIVKELKERGYLAVILHDDDVHGPDAEPIFDGSLDGVLLTTEITTSRLPEEMERRGIPFVMVNREVRSTGGRLRAACIPDNAQGAALVADLLVELGHRDIAMVSGPAATSTGSERRDGFRDALARRGVALHPERLAEVDFSLDSGAAAACRLLAVPPAPTAIFCANDVLALGVLEEARRAGIGVPDGLTVVGFDDIPLAGLTSIGLTTVAVDLLGLARASVDHLLARVVDGGLDPLRQVHSVALVARQSHGPFGISVAG